MYNAFDAMLDGLQVARVGGQIRLICSKHPDAELLIGRSSTAAGPRQFTKSCSVDGCTNIAYSDSEETLDQEVQALGQKIRY
jgi:hypothetical protein